MRFTLERSACNHEASWALHTRRPHDALWSVCVLSSLFCVLFGVRSAAAEPDAASECHGGGGARHQRADGHDVDRAVLHPAGGRLAGRGGDGAPAARSAARRRRRRAAWAGPWSPSRRPPAAPSDGRTGTPRHQPEPDARTGHRSHGARWSRYSRLADGPARVSGLGCRVRRAGTDLSGPVPDLPGRP